MNTNNIDSQIPTCSKYTLAWDSQKENEDRAQDNSYLNFDSSLDGHLQIVQNTSIKQKDHSQVRAVSTTSFLHQNENVQEKNTYHVYSGI